MNEQMKITDADVEMLNLLRGTSRHAGRKARDLANGMWAGKMSYTMTPAQRQGFVRAASACCWRLVTRGLAHGFAVDGRMAYAISELGSAALKEHETETRTTTEVETAAA